MPEVKNMPRKILKILISLLLLVVATVAAIFTVRTFTHKSAPSAVQPGIEGQDAGYGNASAPRPSLKHATRYGVFGVRPGTKR